MLMSRANGWAVEVFTWGWNTIVLGIVLDFSFKPDPSAAWLTRLLPLLSKVCSALNVPGLQTRDKQALCGASRKWRGTDNHCFSRLRTENTYLFHLLPITNCWQWLFNISTLTRWNKKQGRVHSCSPVCCSISILGDHGTTSIYHYLCKTVGVFHYYDCSFLASPPLAPQSYQYQTPHF